MATKRLPQGRVEVRLRAEGKNIKRVFDDRLQAATFEKLVKEQNVPVSEAVLLARGYEIKRKDADGSSMSYREFVEGVWLPRLKSGVAATGRRKKGHSSSTGYAILKRLRIAFPFIGAVPLAGLGIAHYDAMLERLLTQPLNRSRKEPRVYKEATSDKVLLHMRSSLAYAAKIGLITRNPWEDGAGLEIPEYFKEHYTIEECRTFFNCVKKEGNLRDLVMFMITCTLGLRRGETFAISKRSCDWENDVIVFTEQWDEHETRETGEIKFKLQLKNGDPYKIDPISDEIRPLLRQVYDETIGADTKLFPYSLDHMKVTSKIIKPYARKAGLKPISLHRLRDSMITNHSRIGTPEPLIAKLAGCSKPNLKKYQRFNVEDLRGPVNAIKFGIEG